MNFDDIMSTLEALSLDPIQPPELDFENPAPEGYSDEG